MVDNRDVPDVVDSAQSLAPQSLAPGDVVRTADDAGTLAEVVHRNGAVTRLDRVSEIAVDREDDDDRPRIVVTLGPGRTWHHTGPIEDSTLYEVRCPNAVVTARFATFSLVCLPDGATEVTAVEGDVVVMGSVSGSVAVAEGHRATVDAAGMVQASAIAADVADDPWIKLNRALDATGAPPPLPAPTPAPHPPAPPSTGTVPVEVPLSEPTGMPRWVGRALGAGVAAAFVALLAVTFVTADRNDDPSTVAAGGAPTTTAPEPAPTTTAVPPAPPTTAAPIPAPTTTAKPATTPTTGAGAGAKVAEQPKATAKETSCRRLGDSIVLEGTVTNTTNTASDFIVDAEFLRSDGSRFASGSATVTDLGGHQTKTWRVTVQTPSDFKSAGAQCEATGVRPV
jgi:hypothetical protein